jgi:hypothetical protein
MFKTRKAPPPPLQLDSSPSSSSRDGPSTGSYKHYNPLPPTPSSAPSLGHGSPSSPTTFKFWKRKPSASSPTDASFPLTPPHAHSTPTNATNARTHSSSSYASTSSTPLRTSTSNNLPQTRDRQGGSYPSPSPSASNHSSLYNQQQHAYTSPTPQRNTPLPQLPASSSSRSALYFDEDYDWTNGHQSDFAPPSFASPYSTSSLPPPRTRVPAQQSPPVVNWQSSLPSGNTDVPFSAPLPPQRRESDSPKVYVSTRRTGASSSVGGPAPGGFGSHSGWGGAGAAVPTPRRESYGVPVGAARMGHGRKRSRR